MGGLSKKAFQLQHYRSQYKDAATLTVDGGGLLFEHVPVAGSREKQEKITARGIMAAYRQMGYDAVGIARNDLAAGLDYLLEHIDDLPWTSANIMRDGQPLFPTHRMVTAGNFTIGVIGITGGNVKDLLPAGVTVAPWQQTLPPLIAALEKRCDMLVLLSSCTAQENLDIARRFTSLHCIVQANGGNGNRQPDPIRNTLIVQTTSQGKYLGMLAIDWQPSHQWQRQNSAALLRNKRATLDRYKWQISRMEKDGDPAEKYKDNPARLNAYRRLVAMRDKLSAEITRLEKELAAGSTGVAPSRFNATYIGLETTMPDDPAVLEIQQRIKEEINTGNTAAAAGRPAMTTPLQQGYLGWRACFGCHRQITDAWKKTRHATAYDSLEAKGRQFDLDCLACHVTAVETGNEPYALTLAEDLMQVGCEVCHGPGAAHARNPAIAPAPVDEKTCRRCHTPEQDDNFDYARKSGMVH